MSSQRTRIYQIAMELERVTADREVYSWEAAEIDHIIMTLKVIGDPPMTDPHSNVSPRTALRVVEGGRS